MTVWRQFNRFLLKLDFMPKSWEERAALYGAYLVESGIQSATLKSYMSVIKSWLIDDNYKWNQDEILLNTLTRCCRMLNDMVKTRLPIHKYLLEMMLFKIERMFGTQPYLQTMFKAFLILSYYRLFWVGELASGSHPVKAKDVHIALNKNKMLFILYTSKTHGYESRPQKIKIRASESYPCNQFIHSTKAHRITRFFCPFQISREYLTVRGNYSCDTEPFFVLRDHTPITPNLVRNTLSKMLRNLNLNPKNYNSHSFRIGRTGDMLKLGYSIEEIKLAGRWKSNVVYKYIRSFKM